MFNALSGASTIDVTKLNSEELRALVRDNNRSAQARTPYAQRVMNATALVAYASVNLALYLIIIYCIMTLVVSSAAIAYFMSFLAVIISIGAVFATGNLLDTIVHLVKTIAS